MFRFLGLLVLSPVFLAAIALRLVFILPFAVLFLLPMAIMRPRLLLKAPRMFGYMLFARRSGWRGCGYGQWGARIESTPEPIRL